MNTLQTQKQVALLERSRDNILNLGYKLIVFRSKAKKYLKAKVISNCHFERSRDKSDKSKCLKY